MILTDNIKDVVVKSLKLVSNERGHLMEVQRSDDSIYPGFGQAYITSTNPGVIKAWYRHHQQTDQIAVVKGQLLLVLYDTRENSPTQGILQKIEMNEKNPVLVQIPIGIWHGFQCMGNKPAFLLHLNSIAFSFEETDEDRLPFNDSSIPFTWTEL